MNDQSLARCLRAMSQRLRERWVSEDQGALKEQRERAIAGENQRHHADARVDVNRRAWRAAVVAGGLLSESAATGRWGKEAVAAAVADHGSADGRANTIFLKCAEYVVAKHVPKSTWSQLCDRRVPAAYAEAMELMASELDGDRAGPDGGNGMSIRVMGTGTETQLQLALKGICESMLGVSQGDADRPDPVWPEEPLSAGTSVRVPFQHPRASELGELEQDVRVAKVRDPRDPGVDFATRIEHCERIRSAFLQYVTAFIEHAKQTKLTEGDLRHFAKHDQLHLHAIRPYVAEVMELIDWVQGNLPEYAQAATGWRDRLMSVPGSQRDLRRYFGIDPDASLAEWREFGSRFDVVSADLLALEKGNRLPECRLVLEDRRWRCETGSASKGAKKWMRKVEAAKELQKVVPGVRLNTAQVRVKRAIDDGLLLTNGKEGHACRIDRESLESWKRSERKKALDAQE